MSLKFWYFLPCSDDRFCSVQIETKQANFQIWFWKTDNENQEINNKKGSLSKTLEKSIAKNAKFQSQKQDRCRKTFGNTSWVLNLSNNSIGLKSKNLKVRKKDEKVIGITLTIGRNFWERIIIFWKTQTQNV